LNENLDSPKMSQSLKVFFKSVLKNTFKLLAKT